MPGSANILLTFAVVLVAGTLSGQLAKRFHLPSVTGQILAGIVLSLTILSGADAHRLEPVIDFALGLMAVAVGSHLHFARLKVARRRLVAQVFLESTITPVLIFSLVLLLPDTSWQLAALLAAIAIATAPATILALLGGPATFGDGRSLFDVETARPICVETGLWSWPDRPHGLAGKRLTYPELSTLLEIDPSTRERVLRAEMESLVESVKERGVILGHRLYREQPTPNGIERETIGLDSVAPAYGDVDLRTLFESRCVAGDPRLSRLYGALVFERR